MSQTSVSACTAHATETNRSMSESLLVITTILNDIKGSMPPSIGHMELLVWMQRADFSEHIQGCKSPGDPLNSSHFDAPNTKSAPTGYRRAPNIISHHYKQQLSAKASIVPKARPIRFRSNGSLKLSAAQNSHKCHMRAKVNITRY